MTKNQRSFDRPVMMSSEMPSAKYSCSRVVAHIGERQHRDRRPIGGRRLCSHGGFELGRRGAFGEGDAVDADRTRDVLDGLLAHVLEAKTELIAHLIVHDARNQDPAGIGQRFQPGRHIYAITEDVIPVDYDVADVEADAEFDALVRRNTGIALDHTALNVDGAAHGIDHADEFHQHSVTGRLDDPAAMFGDLGVDQFLAMRLELAQRAFLIDAHQPAVAGNVACPYRGQSAVDTLFRHVVAPGTCNCWER